MIDIEEKRIQNLFRSLQKNLQSVLFGNQSITRQLQKKLPKSYYEKDKVFNKLYQNLEDKNFDKQDYKVPLTTPFYKKRTDIDRTTLYSIEKPFQRVHADIADLRFFAKSAVDPKYALLCVDLFTSKIYVYPMKNRSLLAKKLRLFYEEIEPKRNEKMYLQTDLEFKQNAIKNLNKEFNVEMFHTKLRGRKAFAAEQKIREFKKLLLKTKRFTKGKGEKIKPIKVIKNVVENLNKTPSAKYEIPPETVEKNTLNSEFNREMFDFLRVKKVDNNKFRNEKYNRRKDRRQKKLRNPLYLDEKVLVLAERLKKKDAPSKLFKATTDNTPFYNREKIFTIYKRAKLDNGNYLYWIEDENNNKIEGRFVRDELFALKNQFEE